MPRHRRDESEESEGPVDVKRRRVEHKISTGIVKVRHAFKVAKGFEGHKLGRRKRKAVAEAVEDTIRIDAETAALKTLSLDACAKYHFCRTLFKRKAAVDHPGLPRNFKQPSIFTTNQPALNVSARLCNSKPVQEALTVTTEDIYCALGIPIDKLRAPKPRRLRARDFEGGSTTVQTAGVNGQHAVNESTQQPRRSQRPESDGDSEVSDLELDAYEDRLAYPASGESDEERSVSGLEEQLAHEGVHSKSQGAASQNYDVLEDLSISDSDSESASIESELRKAPTARGSSFVPSLTMTGYIDGSDSDIDDLASTRKNPNRRGQRARQAINEKKYGPHAKHLQKQKREARWDPKRGATGGNGHRGGRDSERRTRRSSPDYTVGGSSHPNGQSQRARQGNNNDDNVAIHPSWEAARRAKEKKERPVAFQGRRITFD